MLLVDDLAAGGTKNLGHTPRGLVTLNIHINIYLAVKYGSCHRKTLLGVCDPVVLIIMLWHTDQLDTRTLGWTRRNYCTIL